MTSLHGSVRVHNHEDLIALVPVILGFEPEECVVMLGIGHGGTFSARLDLPGSHALAGDLRRWSAQLLGPARKHARQRVLFVIYGADARQARRVARRLRDDFTRAGIAVSHVVRVHDGRWFGVFAGSGVPDHGVPFDVSAHPIRLQAIVEGVVIGPSRAALRARLDTDAEASRRVAEAFATVTPSDAPSMLALAEACQGGRLPPADREVAAVLSGLLDDQVVAAACALLDQAAAGRQLPFWTEVVRRAPAWLLTEAAAMLAFVAWLSGDGAIAWCAIDRGREHGEQHPLVDLVDQLLGDAVAPDQWTGDLRAIPDVAAG